MLRHTLNEMKFEVSKLKKIPILVLRLFSRMLVAAVCALLLIKLRWPKTKSIRLG